MADVEAERARAGRPIQPEEVDALESLGALLRSFRLAAGLGRRQLAEAAGYHYSHCWALELGTRRTRASALSHYAQALAIACPGLGSADEIHARLVAAAGSALGSEPRDLARYEARRTRVAILRETAREKDAALEAARLKRVEQAKARAHWRWHRANRGR